MVNYKVESSGKHKGSVWLPERTFQVEDYAKALMRELRKKGRKSRIVTF